MSETKRIYQLGFEDGKRAAEASGCIVPVRCRECNCHKSGEINIYEVADDGTMVLKWSFPLDITDEDPEFDAWWYQIWHPPVWTIRKSRKASHKNRRKRRGKR